MILKVLDSKHKLIIAICGIPFGTDYHDRINVHNAQGLILNSLQIHRTDGSFSSLLSFCLRQVFHYKYRCDTNG